MEKIYGLAQFKENSFVTSSFFQNFILRLDDIRTYFKGLAHAEECQHKGSCPNGCCSSQLSAISAFSWDVGTLLGRASDYLGSIDYIFDSFQVPLSDLRAVQVMKDVVKTITVLKDIKTMMYAYVRMIGHRFPPRHRVIEHHHRTSVDNYYEEISHFMSRFIDAFGL